MTAMKSMLHALLTFLVTRVCTAPLSALNQNGDMLILTRVYRDFLFLSRPSETD